jgi:hypothetical protein
MKAKPSTSEKIASAFIIAIAAAWTLACFIF